jgi:nitrile hydratase subunit beta
MSVVLSPGTPIRVRRSYPPGHTRTPAYIRGMTGRIERFVGSFANPEALGYGLSGTPPHKLYRVRFAMRAIWPDYAGDPQDTLDVELYEHWLEAAQDDYPRV